MAIALNKIQNITQFNTGNTVANGSILSEVAINKYKAAIDGLTLSQAKSALAGTKLNDIQKEQILISAGLIKGKQQITLEEVKQMASSVTLTEQKKEEVLTTLQGAYAESEWNEEILEAIILKGGEAASIAKAILAKKQETKENLKNAYSLNELNKALKEELLLRLKKIAKIATNPATWVAAFVGAITFAMYKTSKAIKDVEEKAKELSEEFNSNKSEIEDYKSQIEDLYKTINDSNSSIEDVTNARQTLLSVQDELIDKFGDEKENINLVTKAITGQSEALDTLVEKQWLATKNKFNESNFWNDFANWQEGYNSNIDRMVDDMEHSWANIELLPRDYHSGNYDDVIDKLEQSGWQYSASSGSFVKGGLTEDLYEEIIEIQSLFGEDMPDNFLKSLTKDANKLKDILEDYEAIWDNYILQERILKDENLANQWNAINDAYAEYQEAFKSGDQSRIDSAIAKYADVFYGIINSKDIDASVKEFVQNMYPTMQAEIDKYDFRIKLSPDGINFSKVSMDRLLGKTKDEVLSWTTTDGYQAGEGVFRNILKDATELGIVTGEENERIKQLLDLLVEWGILQDAITEKASDTAVVFDDIFALEDSEGKLNDLGELNEQLDNIQNAYKSLKDAMDTYSATGYITIDQFQSIIEQGSKFLDYLTIEEGKLSLDEQAMYDLAEARIVEMKAKMLQGIIDNVKKIENEDHAATYLASTNYELAESYHQLAINQLEAWRTSALDAGELSHDTIAKIYNKAKNDIDKINALKIDLSSLGGDSGAEAKEAIDSYMDYMEAALEAGKIDYKTYSTEVAAYLKDMYDKGKIAAADYHNYTKQMLEVQKSAYDKALSAVLRRLDKEIESYEKQIEEIDERYQKEIDYIDTIIEQHEEKKKQLQDENDEFERQRNLEKSLYELERSRTQRVNKLYTGEKGYIYTADGDAIRDAEDNVRQSKLDIEIAKIDESIEKLEKQQESLKEACEKEKESIQEIIDNLEEYRKKWEEIRDAHNNAQEDMYAAMILGADWEKIILEGRTAELESFKNDYIAIQDAIIDKAYEAAKAIKDANAVTSEPPKTEERWEVLDQNGNVHAYAFSNKADAEKWVAQVQPTINDDILDPHDHLTLKVDKVKYHTGLEKGYVSSKYSPLSEDERLKMFQKFGRTNLKPGEVPAILKTGELVMTQEQQENMVKNMQMMYGQGMMKNMIPQNVGTNANVQSINLSIGDIQLYGVQNVDDLGNQIVKKLPNVMLQAINKR